MAVEIDAITVQRSIDGLTRTLQDAIEPLERIADTLGSIDETLQAYLKRESRRAKPLKAVRP